MALPSESSSRKRKSDIYYTQDEMSIANSRSPKAAPAGFSQAELSNAGPEIKRNYEETA